jgi:hypothetical protein
MERYLAEGQHRRETASLSLSNKSMLTLAHIWTEKGEKSKIAFYIKRQRL